MEILFAAIVFLIIIYLILKKPTPSAQIRDSPAENEPSVIPNNQVAIDALTRVTKACQDSGGDGFSSLIVAASADGKVSRDELRIIMWFCEARGAKFSDEDVSYVSKLNSGVSLNVSSSAGTAANIISDCSDFDLPTLSRLYAAHTSIGKPWNKTAKRTQETLAVLEGMIAAIGQPTTQP